MKVSLTVDRDSCLPDNSNAARQFFADKGTHQRAFNVEGEGVSAFVILICAEGSPVAALRILFRATRSLRLQVTFQELMKGIKGKPFRSLTSWLLARESGLVLAVVYVMLALIVWAIGEK